MWARYLTVIFVLLAVYGTDARRHHHGHRGHRERTANDGESPTEPRPERFGSGVPHWLSRLQGMFRGDGFSTDVYSHYNSFYPRHRHEPWWEGPNICPRENEDITNATETEPVIRRHYSTRLQYCDESETSYHCKIIEETEEGKREYTIIYECCHGFSRKKGDFGCPQEEEMLPLLQTAQELGLRDFVRAVKLLQLVKQIQMGNLTVFAPIDGSLSLNSNLVDYDPGIMLSDDPRPLIVLEPSIERTVKTLQGAVLGHIIPGLRRTSALHDEEVFETESPEGSTVRINYFEGPEKLMTVNCVRVVSRDHLATNGVIHAVERVLTPVTESLMDLVESRFELTMLKTVLAKADYDSGLEEMGQLTLLAPSDRAFDRLDKRLRARLLRGDRKCLERIMNNHLLPNVICSSAIQGNARTPNLMRRYLNVTRNADDKLLVEDAQIIEADVMAANGVMHIIDEILVPDEALGILQVLEKQGFTELIELIETAKFTDTLEDIDNVTLFAPTNEAIQDLSDAQKSRLSSDPDMLRKVLLYHLSPGENNCQHFYDNKLITSSEGRQIRLNRYHNFMYPQFDVATAQCAPINGPGFLACNGKIKIIHKVMMPPEGNVIDVLARDKRFSTFLSLIKKANLADQLQENGPFTVFAPNNEAFERADKRTLDMLTRDIDQLVNLLKGHVFDGFVCCVRINRGWVFSYPRMYTLAGTTLRLTRDVSGRPKVGHGHVLKCDRTASNGNIQELDRVLLHQHPRRRYSNWRRYWRRRRA